MFGLLPSPWLILGVLLAIGSAFSGGYYKGHHDEYQAQQIEIARLNDKAREVEQQLTEQANNQATKLKKENDDAKAQIAALNSDIASGELRLSIASRVSMPSASAAATGAGAETRCELDPAAAQRIVAIPEDGNAAIRQSNALIDFYNNVRKSQLKGIK